MSLQGHRGAGGVLLQRFDDQGLKQADVVVDGILETRSRLNSSNEQKKKKKNPAMTTAYLEIIKATDNKSLLCLLGGALHWQCLTSAGKKPSALRQTILGHTITACYGSITVRQPRSSDLAQGECCARTHPDVSCSWSACTMLRRLASASACVKWVYGAMKQ